MKAYLIIQSISPCDSAGSDTLLMKKALEEMGMECFVYAARMTVGAAYSGEISSLDSLPEINENDMVIFVHREGALLCKRMAELGGRKILVYHEPVRPKALPKEYDCPAYEELRSHYLGTEHMKDVFDEAVVFSEEGEKDLIAMGYKCSVRHRPLMLSAEHYAVPDRGAVPEEMGGAAINIVYSGKLIPDSHIEDIIAAYSCYRRYYNRRSRLILLSDGAASTKYCKKLKKYAQMLSTEDIIISEAASPEKRGPYIRNAHVLCCGAGNGEFPEAAAQAVFMGIPVIAEDSPAVRLLFESSEELLESFEPHITAAVIDRIISDDRFREQLASVQRNEAAEHGYDKVSALFKSQIKEFIQKNVVNDREENCNSKSEIRS